MHHYYQGMVSKPGFIIALICNTREQLRLIALVGLRYALLIAVRTLTKHTTPHLVSGEHFRASNSFVP